MADIDVVLRINDQQYSQSIDRINKGLTLVQKNAQGIGHSTVSSTQAASAAIRELNGDITNNIRAVEKFITTIPGVGSALQSAFPVVGAIAFGGVLVEMGSKVAAFVKQVNDMPKSIAKGFQDLSVSTESSTDELQMHILKTQDAIAKLTGKPSHNGAAEALVEARIAADDLAKSLSADASKMDALLKAHQIGIGGSLLTGNARTADVTGSVTSYEDKFTDLSYQYQQALQKGNTSVAADLKKQLGDAFTSAHDYARGQIGIRKSLQNEPGAFNQGANIAILEQFDQSISDRQNQSSTEAQAKQGDADLLRVQQAHDAQERAKEAARQQAEWIKSVQEAGNKNFQEQLDAQKNPALIQPNITGFFGQNANQNSGASGYQPHSALGDNEGALKEQGVAAQDYLKSLEAMNEAQVQASDSFRNAQIQIGLASGTLTAYGAAVAVAADHTDDFQRKWDKAQDDLAKAKANNDQTSVNNATANITQLQGQRSVELAQDNQSITSNSQMGEFVASVNKLTDSLNNVSQGLSQAFGGAVQGTNDQILNALTGKRTNFTQVGSDLFKGVANTGLNKLEGMGLSALGLGGSGKLGTQSNPMYVKIADSLSKVGGSAVSSIGHAISGLFGSGSKSSASSASSAPSLAGSILQGFFADGGDVVGNRPAVVGEAGPELFVPQSAGTIIPNNELGGTTHNFNADFTGASFGNVTRDEMHATVTAAMRQAIGVSVNAAPGHASDQNSRRPASMRR